MADSEIDSKRNSAKVLSQMPIQKLHLLKERLSAAVLGSEKAGELLLTALLARGHALIEGAPGVGKTSLAQGLASGIGGTFSRIQFTPDLLPSDILLSLIHI